MAIVAGAVAARACDDDLAVGVVLNGALGVNFAVVEALGIPDSHYTTYDIKNPHYAPGNIEPVSVRGYVLRSHYSPFAAVFLDYLSVPEDGDTLRPRVVIVLYPPPDMFIHYRFHESLSEEIEWLLRHEVVIAPSPQMREALLQAAQACSSGNEQYWVAENVRLPFTRRPRGPQEVSLDTCGVGIAFGRPVPPLVLLAEGNAEAGNPWPSPRLPNQRHKTSSKDAAFTLQGRLLAPGGLLGFHARVRQAADAGRTKTPLGAIATP